MLQPEKKNTETKMCMYVHVHVHTSEATVRQQRVDGRGE